MITNGIWYLGAYLGAIFQIEWLIGVCSAYIIWLYTPFAQEKFLIIPVALWLCKILFKNHEKTKKDLDVMWETAKSDFNKFKNKFKRKKESKID